MVVNCSILPNSVFLRCKDLSDLVLDFSRFLKLRSDVVAELIWLIS